MTLETLAAPTLDGSDDMFDFSRPSVRPSPLTTAELAALRADPAPGWAAANPEKAMLFLYLAPRDSEVFDELFAA